MAENIMIRFQSAHQALKAEKALKSCSLKCRMIPIPRKLSPDCGIALQIAQELKDQAEAALLDRSIQFEGFYELD
jgi:hypothetical protein